MVALAVREAVTQAVQMGLGPQELSELVHQEYQALQMATMQAAAGGTPGAPAAGMPPGALPPHSQAEPAPPAALPPGPLAGDLA